MSCPRKSSSQQKTCSGQKEFVQSWALLKWMTFYLIKHWQIIKNGLLYKLTQEGCIPAPAWTFGKSVCLKFEESGAGGCSLAQNTVKNTCQAVSSGKITLEGHRDLVLERLRACCLGWLTYFSFDDMLTWSDYMCLCLELGAKRI